MERLTYESLKKSGYKGFLLEDGKEKIIQFGEGNFLRGFVDYFINRMNEEAAFNAKVTVVQPISKGKAYAINDQEGLYTLYLRGRTGDEVKNEKSVISCISRALNPYDEFEDFLKLAENDDIEIIVSNTTEAGIVYDSSCKFADKPPVSFPAKLTRLLYERFKRSKAGSGYLILSCELIDDNGKHLKEAVKRHSEDWELGDAFISWLEDKNVFCSTLVDRIVTGYPADAAGKINKENGYEDMLLDTAEYFGLWVIEGPKSIYDKIPFKKADLPVLITDNHKPYKVRKVRILNGAHTAMVPVALLCGEEIVRSSMKDEYIGRFVRELVYDEVIPTIDLPKSELEGFAEDVFDRFENPFIDHKLKDISLNSISKWTARLKPTLKDYVSRYSKLPSHIVFGFAALIAFYKKGETNDSDEVKKFFAETDAFPGNSEMLSALLKNKKFFGEDLIAIEGFSDQVTEYLSAIEDKGMSSALRSFLEA